MIETVASIAGSQLLSMLVAWGQEKHEDRKRRERVHDIFHDAFTQLDNQNSRVGILCDKSSAFRNDMFSLAKGNYQGITRMVEEAKKYWEESGDQNFSPAKINEAFYKFGCLLCDQSKEHGDTTVGALAISFSAFTQDARHLHFGQRSGGAEPATPKPSQPLFYLPHSRNRQLRDYDGYVRQIQKELGASAQVAVKQADLALSGQGGLGKTAMAVAYAYEYADHYPGGVFWVQADLGLGQALAELAKGLGWELPPGLTDQQIIEVVLGQLRTPEPKLIILDNQEEKVLPEGIDQVPASHLLVTTRLTDVNLGGQVSMALPAEEEALGIFLAYAGLEGKELSERQKEAAYAICQRVGLLPLGLEIMGKNARKTPLPDLAGALEKANQAVRKKSTVLTKSRERSIAAAQAAANGSTAPESTQELTIAAALAVTSQKYDHPRAGEALLYLAYLYPEELDNELLALVMSKNIKEAREIVPEAQAMLESLAEFSVVQPKPDGGYAMHRLVQEAARLEDEGQEVGERVASVLNAAIRIISEKEAYQAGYRFIPHLLHLADFTPSKTDLKSFPNAYHLARWAEFLLTCSHYKYAEYLQRLVVARVETARGKRHQDYATALNNLAAILKRQGKTNEAEGLINQALTVDELTIGTGNHEYATTLNNLAEVLLAQGEYAEAVALYEQVLAIDQETIGKENQDYAIHLNNLAGAMRKQGKLSDAKELHIQALSILEKTIGNENHTYAVGLNNLGGVLEDQGELIEAEKLYRQAMTIDEKTFGKDNQNYAISINNLAVVLRKQGKLDEAVWCYREAVDIFIKVLGPENPDTISAQQGLGSLLSETKAHS